MFHNRLNKRYMRVLLISATIILIVVGYNSYNGNVLNMYYTQNENPLSWDGVPTPKDTLVDWKQVNQMRRLPKSVDWSKIKRTPPSKEDMHDKWIVVTSIAAPTSDVKLLSQIAGWKLLVVGDKKTPKSWRYF